MIRMVEQFNFKGGEFICVTVAGNEAPLFGIYRCIRLHGPKKDYVGLEFYYYDEGHPIARVVPIGEKPGNKATVINRDFYIVHLQQCLNALKYREQNKDIYPIKVNWAEQIKYLDDLIRKL